jgi:hypothetical protein
VFTIAQDPAEILRLCIPSLIQITLIAGLAACSGSSGGSSGGADAEGPTAPGLSFAASPISVPAGGSTTLTWRASHAASCEASGAWTGSRPLSGSAQVGPIDSDQLFRLSCSGSGGGVSRQVTVALDSGQGPAISLRADPEQVNERGASTLIWSVVRADSCTATGGWTGSRPLSGSFGTGPLKQTTSFGLSCSGPGGNALESVFVDVGDRWLRWQAPTQNVDGSPITDLAGYVVYWGTQSRSYTGSHTIKSPSVTKWRANVAPGTYYFALTAVDGEGNESGYSNEVRKSIL